MGTYELTDVQWKLVKPLVDPKGRRGPKVWYSRGRMVEAVLWLARTPLLVVGVATRVRVVGGGVGAVAALA